MQGMLSFLLFAGALHIDLENLARQKWLITAFATFGVVCSTLLIGGAVFIVFQWLGLSMPWVLRKALSSTDQA